MQPSVTSVVLNLDKPLQPLIQYANLATVVQTGPTVGATCVSKVPVPLGIAKPSSSVSTPASREMRL